MEIHVCLKYPYISKTYLKVFLSIGNHKNKFSSLEYYTNTLNGFCHTFLIIIMMQ